MTEKHLHRRDDEDHSYIYMRDEDPWARKSKVFSDLVKTLGFPIIVCIYFAFQQYTQGRETIQAINAFKDVVNALKSSIESQTKILDQQNHILRRKNHDD